MKKTMILLMATLTTALVVAAPALAQVAPTEPDTPVSEPSGDGGPGSLFDCAALQATGADIDCDVPPGSSPGDQAECERFNEQYGTEIDCGVLPDEGIAKPYRGDRKEQPRDAFRDSGTTIRGFITSISGPAVLVEENPQDPVHSGSGSPKGSFTVTGETEILRQQGGEHVPASFDELRVGQLVDAAYLGPVAESYPTQGTADKITILEANTPDDEPRCFLPEGCDAEPVVATGEIEELGATTFQYGTHALLDGDTGEIAYALTSEEVDLDAYNGELATIYGALVPGYEDGQVEGGPPLVEVSRVETAPDEETVTATFELAVEGEPPAGTAFGGAIGQGPEAYATLLDEDGDGLYTASLPVEKGTEHEVWIEQASPLNYDDPQAPLVPTTIEDFGSVEFDEDKTLSASVSFDDGTSGGGSDNDSGDSGGGSSDDSGSAGSGFLHGATGGIRGLLPSTGGMTLATLAAGMLLVGSGVFVRKLFW